MKLARYKYGDLINEKMLDKELMMQWHSDINARLNIDCGLIGGDMENQADITIVMLQTHNKRPELQNNSVKIMVWF